MNCREWEERVALYASNDLELREGLPTQEVAAGFETPDQGAGLCGAVFPEAGTNCREREERWRCTPATTRNSGKTCRRRKWPRVSKARIKVGDFVERYFRRRT